MKRSISNFIVCGIFTILVVAYLSCDDSVNEDKSTNRLPPNPTSTISTGTTPKPTPTITGEISAEPSPTIHEFHMTPEEHLTRIRKLLNATGTEVKKKAMSPREREEEELIRGLVGRNPIELEREVIPCGYGVFIDKGQLEVKIFGCRDLPKRNNAMHTINANVRNLDPDKIKNAGNAIEIPCKDRSGKCVGEVKIKMSELESTRLRSSIFSINLYNFSATPIPTELAVSFSEVIKFAQTNPTYTNIK